MCSIKNQEHISFGNFHWIQVPGLVELKLKYSIINFFVCQRSTKSTCMLDNSVRLIWVFVGVTQAWSDMCRLTGSNTSGMMIEVHYNWGHFFHQVIHICCNWKQKSIRTAIITHAWTNRFASIPVIKTHSCYNFIKTVPRLTRDERVQIMVHLFHRHLLDQQQTPTLKHVHVHIVIILFNNTIITRV